MNLSETASEQLESELVSLETRVDSQNALIAEKDDIISALIERLEQAAEQLDRSKRTGADRRPQPSAGVPLELIEQNAAIKTDVEAIATQFEGMDLGRSFHRLEMMLEEVRDLVVQPVSAPPEVVAPIATRQPLSSETDPALQSSWDAIKQQILSGDTENDLANAVVVTEDEFTSTDKSANPATVSADDAPERGQQSPTGGHAFPPIEPLPEALPAPLDLDAADRETLIEAIEHRDQYIGLLTRRVEDRRAKLTTPTDWSALASCDSDLVDAVQRLHEELTDAVRTSEVDLCLERAKLSRERTRIETLLDQTAEKEANAARAVANEGKSKSSQRWRRMLGIDEENE